MPNEELTPATDDQVLFSLSFALQHDGKKQFRHAGDLSAQIVARHLLEHLKRSNYVIMKGPPSKPHSTPK